MDLSKENESLKAELERIKAKYGEHLDSLQSENKRLKAEIKLRTKAFIDLMIALQDTPLKDSE